jgi:2-methylcitrate dehydratase PrpD
MVNNTPRIDAIVDRVATIRADEIPCLVIQKAVDLFVDTLGCIFAGSTAEGIDELKKTILYWSTSPQGTILVSGEKTSAPYAALVNSVMGHSRDYDDAHDLAANHGSVVVVPALMATAEACSRGNNTDAVSFFQQRQISGKEFISALAVGLEVTNRLAMAFAPYLHAGWLPTTLWGPFGAAAACGRLLSLDTKQMHHAFGLAYSQIHGNRQALLDGALAKRMQPGFSASAGLQSAFLAASGITAAANIISGNFGIPILYTGGNVDAEYINTGLGQFEETMNISIKPYPSCRCTHAVADAVLEIQKHHALSWKDIESGVIYLPPTSMAQIGQPFSVRNNPTVDAQFSAQYVAALTFIHGKPRISDFETQKIVSRQEVIQLARRFMPVEFEKETVEIGLAELEISLKNGQVIHTRIDNVKGSPANPLLPEEQESKFLDCLDSSGRKYSLVEKKHLLSIARAITDFDDIAGFIDSIQKYANKPIATRGTR